MKRKWLSDLELEEIKKNVEDLEQGMILEEVEFDAIEAYDMNSPNRINDNEVVGVNQKSSVNDEKRNSLRN